LILDPDSDRDVSDCDMYRKCRDKKNSKSWPSKCLQAGSKDKIRWDSVPKDKTNMKVLRVMTVLHISRQFHVGKTDECNTGNKTWDRQNTQYCVSDKIKKNEMGGACSAFGGSERHVQDFGEET